MTQFEPCSGSLNCGVGQNSLLSTRCQGVTLRWTNLTSRGGRLEILLGQLFHMYTETEVKVLVLAFKKFHSYLIHFLQVHLQTQQQVTQRLSSMAVHVVRTQGVLALYNGLSASLTRQVIWLLLNKDIFNNFGHDQLAEKYSHGVTCKLVSIFRICQQMLFLGPN